MSGNRCQPPNHSQSTSAARVWQEEVVIPTYGIGPPNPNPMFLEKRVYQGSSGAVYPLPVIDRIEDEKRDRAWQAVFLENEFLKIMILPELGGRVQMALDKTNDYHFVYYNRVIKPALVGLAGPWISGGIEFNWPQHHRPSTFMPVDCEIAEDAGDGSRDRLVHEIDRMHRHRRHARLHAAPGQGVAGDRRRLYNRTDLPQTFLWWANPAVHVDENHQSIFPPDVNAVMDHGKRDVSCVPDCHRRVLQGRLLARHRHQPLPEHPRADVVHGPPQRLRLRRQLRPRATGRPAACLQPSCLARQEAVDLGNGDFGQAWDRHLTDEDGPYIELMCGVFTDNQPDFSWLMPGEEKSFTQYFMPYKGVGVVKNATVDAAVGLEIDDGNVTVRVYTTSPQPGARATLQSDEAIVWGMADSTVGRVRSSSRRFRCRMMLRGGIGDQSRCRATASQLVAWTVPAEVETRRSRACQSDRAAARDRLSRVALSRRTASGAVPSRHAGAGRLLSRSVAPRPRRCALQSWLLANCSIAADGLPTPSRICGGPSSG